MRILKEGLLLLSAALCAGLTSCSDESPWQGSDTEGGISLNLSTDGRVMRQTRADDSVSPVVPETASFSVSLSKSDGSYSNSWSTLEAFNREDGFPIGDYTLEAFYGDVEKEGFDNPYYRGVADVHVAPGAESETNVTATLANAMVSIRYTDAFRENFSAWSAAVQTEGHDWVVMAQNETRPVYIAPSEVKLNLTLTNDSGDRVVIQPAGFSAKARHHYVVTIGVEGGVNGTLALDVQFDEDVVAETVNVPLGDQLWTAPAPSIKGKGFTLGTPFEVFESATVADSPEFNIFAYGGLRQATLNIVSSNSYAPAFGRSVDLVGCDALTQQQLAASGVDCSGFFRNVDKMGVVNVRNFISKLPAGDYKLEMSAVDMMTRTSEPVVMDVKVKAVDVELSAPVTAAFMADQVSVDLSTNCADIRDNVTFRVPDANNKLVPATIKSVTAVTSASPAPRRTRSDLPYTFRYVLAVSQITGTSVDVEATCGTKVRTVAVPVNVPEFSVTPDAYARKVVFRINAADGDRANVTEQVRFFNGDNQIPAGNITRDLDNGLVTVIGLSPSTTYSNISCMLGKIKKAVPAFTTEAATDVTNGAFSSVTRTIDTDYIHDGGQWRIGLNDYWITVRLKYDEANGWASLNQLTCNLGSNPVNTWFCVPSTFVQNGQAVIRSVGYNHKGQLPERYKSDATYYNPNPPAESQFIKTAGEMFLGSYSFNGDESRTNGIAFGSRPTSISFDYKYAPVNSNEQGEMILKVFDASDNVIASQTLALGAVSAMASRTVAIQGYPFGVKAAKLYIGFRSTKTGVTPAINIPSGGQLDEGYIWSNFVTSRRRQPDNTYKALATGSVLTVDNVKLGYGSESAAAVKYVKRRIRK